MPAPTQLGSADQTQHGEGRRPSSDRFDVGPLLGRGGMGEVRLARDLRVDRDVAIKLLRGTAHPEAVARFLREARVQGRLDHPAIVPVYDCGVDDEGVPYFAMKRLTGVTLERVLETPVAAWPRRQLLARFVDVCLAIELAHTRGVVHRDLKPSNIMLGDFGEVYVLDWGIASIDADELAVGSGEHVPVGETATGALLGTPGYMAPEQIEGRVEARSDVFALGLVLFEILAGRPALPRGAAAFEATLAAACHRPSTIAADVPPELDDICTRATAKHIADRWPTARALADAVNAYLAGDRDVTRRRELVESYLAAADRALLAGDFTTAMREVNRALALEPNDVPALAMLRRVLLEPPREVPAEALAKRDADRARESKIQLAIAQKIYACFLALMPFALFARSERMSMIGVGAVSVCLVAMIAGTRYVRDHLHLLDRWLVVQALAHGAMLAVMATVVGPFQIVPIVSVVSLALFLNHPAVRRYDWVIGLHLIFAVLPIGLEELGLTPSTYSFDDQTMRISMLSEGLAPWMILIAIAVTVWLLQAVVAWTILRQRRAQETARERLHLYAWRLEQMLPRDANARFTIPPR